jgi:RNA polymerase sigma-70 factor (sigma-E family)
VSAPTDYVDSFDNMFAIAYRAAYAVLGDRGDAEDCAQDTLAKALVKWRRIHGHAVPWIARVATNGAIDRFRKRERSRPVGEPENSVPGRASGVSSNPAEHIQQRADLVRALKALPRRQREMIVLRHLLDLSEAETASELRCSVGSVKSATSRGLAALRQQLGPMMIPEPALVSSPKPHTNSSPTNI